MPQSERSDNLKKILKWLSEKPQTTAAIIFHIKWHITEGGATDNTAKRYIEDLHNGGLIEYKHPFYKITELGKQWLERYSI